MKVCEYCGNSGTAFAAVKDLKKGEYGWFRVAACKCKHRFKHYQRILKIGGLDDTRHNQDSSSQ